MTTVGTAPPDLLRRSLAEFLGTAFLLMAVVGSGIAAAELSPTDAGLALFETAAATGFALVAIILTFRTVSGAHINPAVSIAAVRLGHLPARDGASYVGAQVAGAVVGTILANLMFAEPAVAISATDRITAAVFLGEAVATFGLVVLIFGMVRNGQTDLIAFGVGTYIAGAYFFTSSTSFANPAVTLARTLTDTFAGIAPASVPGFLGAEAVGLVAAILVVPVVWPRSPA